MTQKKASDDDRWALSGVSEKVKAGNYNVPPPDKRGFPNRSVIKRAKGYVNNHMQLCHHELPTFPGLCGWLGLESDVVLGWLDNTEDERCVEFDRVCKMLKDKFEHILLHDGLNNSLNPAVTTLILGHDYGYQKSQKVTGEDGGPLRISLDISKEDAQKNYDRFMGHKAKK